MKICIFTETYYPVVGGGETQAKLLAEALTTKGHSVIVLTRRSDLLLKNYEQYGAVHVYRLPPVGRGQLKKWGLLFSSFPMLIHLQRQYDLIFVSGFRIIGIAGILVSRIFHKKCILKSDSQGEMSGAFFVNGLKKFGLSPSWLPFKLFLNIRNKVLAGADGFSAISADIAEEFSMAGIKPKLIHIIPNSVDTARFYPVTRRQKIALRKKLGIPQNAMIVIYTGRIVSYKGLPLLLKVWRDLYKKHNKILLLLVGTGGLDMYNCEIELRSYVRENWLDQYIRFTGSVQNVAEYLQASDIFAFPTEDDALPSSLIEAMACALPIVTTPVGAIKAIVKDGENGIVIQPGDYQQLYQALETLMVNPHLASLLGQAALKTIQSQFSSDIVIERYLSLFRQTTNRAASPLGPYLYPDN